MPVAVAGAGVLVSAYAAKQSGDQASRAYQLQQQGLQQDQAFRQQQLDDYNKTYGPMIQALTQKASGEQPLNLGPTWAKIQGTFDQAGRNNTATMAKNGTLGSGLDRNSTLETGRAMALSDAYSKGLQNKDDLMQRLIQAGKQMPGQTEAAMQGNQNMANFQGQQGGIYANAAGQGMSSLASALGGLGRAWGMSRPTNQNPTGTPLSFSPIGTDMTDARNSASIPNPLAQPLTSQDISMGNTMFNQSPIQQQVPDLSVGSVPDGMQAPWNWA